MNPYKLRQQNWNLLDIAIFTIENVINCIISKIKQYKKDNVEPDAELLINAATEHLRDENEKLKEKQYPAGVLIIDKQYYCPDCGIQIDYPLLKVYRTKYCPECGKRIFLPPATPYAMSHIDLPVESIQHNSSL